MIQRQKPTQQLEPGIKHTAQLVTRASILSQHTGLSLEQLNRERGLVLEALEIRKLGGSIVAERVSCGKRSCSRCGGFQKKHGPYDYLHYYDPLCPWKVRKRYLGKALGMLSCHKTEELKQRLREIDRLLVTSKDKGRKETNQTSVPEQLTRLFDDFLKASLSPREILVLRALSKKGSSLLALTVDVLREKVCRQPKSAIEVPR